MERKGRTKAEKQLRHIRMQLAAAQAAAGADAAGAGLTNGSAAAGEPVNGDGSDGEEDATPGCCVDEDKLSAAASSVAGIRGQHPPISMFPFRPIGYLQSCFSTRCVRAFALADCSCLHALCIRRPAGRPWPALTPHPRPHAILLTPPTQKRHPAPASPSPLCPQRAEASPLHICRLPGGPAAVQSLLGAVHLPCQHECVRH